MTTLQTSISIPHTMQAYPVTNGFLSSSFGASFCSLTCVIPTLTHSDACATSNLVQCTRWHSTRVRATLRCAAPAAPHGSRRTRAPLRSHRHRCLHGSRLPATVSHAPARPAGQLRRPFDGCVCVTLAVGQRQRWPDCRSRVGLPIPTWLPCRQGPEKFSEDSLI